MFGELAAIDDEPRSANVVALTDSLLVHMPAEDFWEILKRYPAACTVALKSLTALIRLLCDRVVEFSTLGVKSRIHRELLRLAHKHLAGDNRAVISPIPTHVDIASRVSSHREAVAREMSRLGHIGILERQSDALIVCDVAKLVELVEDSVGRKSADLDQ